MSIGESEQPIRINKNEKSIRELSMVLIQQGYPKERITKKKCPKWIQRFIYCRIIGVSGSKFISSELGTFEWYISGLKLNLLSFLISRLNNACSPLVINPQIN